MSNSLFESHLHTSETSYCATSSIRAQLKSCKNKKFQAVAITDHNSLNSHRIIEKENIMQDFPELIIVPGIEVSIQTENGIVHCLVYSNSIDKLECFERAEGFDTIDDFANQINKEQHYVIWAHPSNGRGNTLKRLLPKNVRLKFRGLMKKLPPSAKKFFFNSNKELTKDEYYLLDIVNGIEAVNGTRGDLRERSPIYFKESNGRHKLSGGSDSHITVETGSAPTVLEGMPKDVKDVLNILFNGEYYPLTKSLQKGE